MEYLESGDQLLALFPILRLVSRDFRDDFPKNFDSKIKAGESLDLFFFLEFCGSLGLSRSRQILFLVHRPCFFFVGASGWEGPWARTSSLELPEAGQGVQRPGERYHLSILPLLLEELPLHPQLLSPGAHRRRPGPVQVMQPQEGHPPVLDRRNGSRTL